MEVYSHYIYIPTTIHNYYGKQKPLIYGGFLKYGIDANIPINGSTNGNIPIDS